MRYFLDTVRKMQKEDPKIEEQVRAHCIPSGVCFRLDSIHLRVSLQGAGMPAQPL